MEKLVNSQLKNEFIDWPVHMARAIELATYVINANPNPRVGCVLVDGNGVVSEGWHVFPGEPHAEMMALSEAEEKGLSVKGATAFVSLEPCAHIGRTGPCAVALVEAQVACVVIAVLDPNPKVCGRGIEILEEAGIKVFHLVEFESQARALNLGFHKRHETGLPWVKLKLASSLDGRTALSNGESQWITGAQARSDVQKLRLASSAILTGIGSVLKDDPRMNVRVDDLNLPEAEIDRNRHSLALQPLKVILDSKLRTPPNAQILASGRVIIFTTAGADAQAGFRDALVSQQRVEVVEAKVQGSNTAAGVDLMFVLKFLAQLQCNEVFVEAGTTLSSAFVEQQLADELVVYIAPKIMGADAMPLYSKTGIAAMNDVLGFEITSLVQMGDDIKVTLMPTEPKTLTSTEQASG